MYCLTVSRSEERIRHIFKDFLAGVAKLEELVTAGSGFLSAFQQGLEFLRRPPVSKTSELVKDIIKMNDTKRLQAYVQSGCTNTHDNVQSTIKCKSRDMPTWASGLYWSSAAKILLNELDGLIQDATDAIQTLNEDSLPCYDEQLASGLEQEDASSSIGTTVTDYACMMGIIYCMLKKDYMMQGKIVSSINLKSSSGELETYCMMWSLRPFINDEKLRRAWKLIP